MISRKGWGRGCTTTILACEPPGARDDEGFATVMAISKPRPYAAIAPRTRRNARILAKAWRNRGKMNTLRPQLADGL
jgi:hypothetical protein